MPSSMVHLMAAYEYRPDAPGEFWLGNIVPDCIDDWKEKDKFHFRDVPDRGQALNNFAESIRKDDLFSEGMLLHLFVDWKWDEDLRRQYISNYNSGDWFQPYRNEIGLLSARLYHDTHWSAKVWEDMLSCDIPRFIRDYKVISEDFSLSILQRANKYHVENPSAQSLFYSVEAIKEFTFKTAKDYQYWRGQK